MQEPSYLIRPYTLHDVDALWHMLDAFGFSNDRNYYERCIERHVNKELTIIVAFENSRAIGFCLLNWQPKYAYFKLHGFPEIQDLNVLSAHRNKGVGAALIRFCEEMAREKGCTDMGIGVGLDSSFGAAQRLYVKMGYIPDGQGVTYDRKQVAKGEFRPIDENLSIMMTKSLKD